MKTKILAALFALALGIALIALPSHTAAATTPLLPEVKAQLDTWVNESGGLRDEMVDPLFLNDAANQVVRTSLGGLSLIVEQQSELDCFNYLILNDGHFQKVAIKADWVRMLKGLVDSYVVAQGGLTSYGVTFPGYRSLTPLETSIKTQFQAVIVLGGG